MPKILWSSPYSPIDRTSGASINALKTLQFLKKVGFEVWSCSGFCCDRPIGVQEIFELINNEQNDPQKFVFQADHEGVHYVFTRTHSSTEIEMSLEECQLHYTIFNQILDEFKPDFVYGYGLSPLAILCRYAAQQRGIKVIQLVVNGEQVGYNFPFTDLLVSDSFATSDLYTHKELINIKNPGVMLNPEEFISPIHKPQFVTMINTSAQKGVSIFTKLIDACATQLPHVTFLGIETRSKFYEELPRLHEKDNPQNHPFKDSKFKNLQLLPLQKNVKNVYAITKVLVVPSLWFESLARSSIEAAFNGIAVLSSKSGGIPEACVGAGISLETPEHCRQDYYSLPTDEEIQPWVDALKAMLEKDWSQEFTLVKQLHHPRISTLRFLTLLHKMRPDLISSLLPQLLNEPFAHDRLNQLYAPDSLQLDGSTTCKLNVTEDASFISHAGEQTGTDHNSARSPLLSMQGALHLCASIPAESIHQGDFAIHITKVTSELSETVEQDSSNAYEDSAITPTNYFEQESPLSLVPQDFNKFFADLGLEGVTCPLDENFTAPTPKASDITKSESVATTTALPQNSQLANWSKHCNSLSLEQLFASFDAMQSKS